MSISITISISIILFILQFEFLQLTLIKIFSTHTSNNKPMSKKSILRLIQDYLRKYPTPAEITILDGMLKLGYSYTMPYTNSKNKRQMFMPVQNIEKKFIEPVKPLLNYVEKENRIQQGNTISPPNSISTQEAHEKVFQDSIFGTARLSEDGSRWVYVAKKKQKKDKSHFMEGGVGKTVYIPDFGETYDDVNEVGIFIWDLKSKKIHALDIKVQNDEPSNSNQYIFAYPIFANATGSKIICHGYKREQFGHGILHCFNRRVTIFQLEITQNTDILQVKANKLFKQHETNMFANISPCFNYILYFAGEGYTHTYYMDLVIMKRFSSSSGEKEGCWKETHRIKQAFVGYYDTVRSETFIFEGCPYAYFQTIEKSEQVIKRINLESGELVRMTENCPGESFSITGFSREAGLAVGGYTSHKNNSFFYMKHGEKPIVIPPLNSEQIIIKELKEPIHGYFLYKKSQLCEEFKKEKMPLILLIHGGPHGHGDACLTLFKYMLVKMGYAILIPSFSGSVGFGPDFLKNATGNIGKTDADEIIKLLENVLKENDFVDAEKVYTYGGSYGGYMSAIMGSRYHKYFKKAIILNGVLSIPANLWFTDIPQWNVAETLSHNRLENLTEMDYLKMFEQSPISQPMKIPTLQFLGAKDRRVPYRQGLLFDAITKKAGTEIKTYVYENSAHSLSDSVNTTLDVIIKSLLFLEGVDE